ncbi:hypothetical protein [Streptomyces tsukubensis]|uniref:Uncharacterized protein n=1 Tax=Streptomyces tsukubensis TaxID=83656 RepID=A0A1V4A8Z3_9ACTN|nr:hypothetical protein [Streptomyces tsukubensis]OON79691.1 hypothetical protein B1H18_14100 [Streptomyces tsukubensis]QFR95881.1 hypothetical protein GBW32_26125 [Streptomyces tsukubensis]
MFTYELQKIRSAELLVEAEHERRVREAVNARRAERRAERASRRSEAGGRVKEHSRHWFTRAA